MVVNATYQGALTQCSVGGLVAMQGISDPAIRILRVKLDSRIDVASFVFVPGPVLRVSQSLGIRTGTRRQSYAKKLQRRRMSARWDCHSRFLGRRSLPSVLHGMRTSDDVKFVVSIAVHYPSGHLDIVVSHTCFSSVQFRVLVLQVCLLDLDYNLPVQVRDQALGADPDDELPESDVGKEYALAERAKDGTLQGKYLTGKPNDTILALQRTTPYYKVLTLSPCEI